MSPSYVLICRASLTFFGHRFESPHQSHPRAKFVYKSCPSSSDLKYGIICLEAATTTSLRGTETVRRTRTIGLTFVSPASLRAFHCNLKMNPFGSMRRVARSLVESNPRRMTARLFHVRSKSSAGISAGVSSKRMRPSSVKVSVLGWSFLLTRKVQSSVWWPAFAAIIRVQPVGS